VHSFNDLLAAPAKPVARPRNVFWDSFFYDVLALTAEERSQLASAPDKEGAVIVVSPSSRGRPIRHYETVLEMLAAEAEGIHAVAVAGVGSSIVGTAALARNVADTYDFDVAGIVSGYGASDLVAEAMGGWFFYGFTDRLRYNLEEMIERMAGFLPEALARQGASASDLTIQGADMSIPPQLDSGTLLDILLARPPNLRLLIGHSKGSLLIDYVLTRLCQRMGDGHHPYYDDLNIVTVSAVVALPSMFANTFQIIGKLDWFGGINSVPDLLRSKDPKLQPRFIDNAWHHLNPSIPYHLSLNAALATHVKL
jgi:hypothetical protein